MNAVAGNGCVLEAIGISKRFGAREVLRGVSLRARRGDVVSMIGSSGSGKSTCPRGLNLLEQPHGGGIAVDGETLALMPDRSGAQPRLMLLDEPTSALDPELVGEVLRVMRGVAEEGRTMIVATHEMSFAREVGNHLVFLHQRQVEEAGPPREVLARPQSERLRGLLSNALKQP